jgi:hypothetical protein
MCVGNSDQCFGEERVEGRSSALIKLLASVLCLGYYYNFQLRTAALRLIVRSRLDVPTFATTRHHARAPTGGR